MDLSDGAQSSKTASTSATKGKKTKKGSKSASNTDSSNVLVAASNSNKEQRDSRCSLENVPLDILHEVHHLLTTYHFDPAEWLSACADIRLP